MQPARKLATYEDLLALSDDIRAEILAGEIIVNPSPLPEHGRIQGTLGRFVGGPFDYDGDGPGPGGWWILPEVDVRLARHEIVRPDMSGWQRPRLPSPWGTRPIDVVPDWICEILSPSNASHDRIRKANLYAESGVAFLWILTPWDRSLEAFALRDGIWSRIAAHLAEDVARVPPFDAIELAIGKLFPPAPP